MTDFTHVPDKLHAYSLQIRHMLYELISTEVELTVSTEAYDDVAIQYGDSIHAEQIKSALSEHNPLANRAEEFWKSLYNWCRYFETNVFPNNASVILRYVVISQKNFNIGSLPQAVHDSLTDADAEKVVLQIRQEYYGEGRNQPTEKSKIYIDYLLDPNNLKTVKKVIAAVKIENFSGNYDDQLISKFNTQIIPEEYKAEIFDAMLGWVYNQVHMQTSKNQAAFISVTSYREALKAQIRGRDIKRILSAVSSEPSDLMKEKEVASRGTYIRQLELIDADEEALLDAANDFIRSKIEKTEWSRRGLIIEENLNEYNECLVRVWKLKRENVKLSPTDSKSKDGRKIYLGCKESALTLTLQGCETPSFFGSGCLHDLADKPDDIPRIGWHPDYKKLLQEDKSSD